MELNFEQLNSEQLQEQDIAQLRNISDEFSVVFFEDDTIIQL